MKRVPEEKTNVASVSERIWLVTLCAVALIAGDCVYTSAYAQNANAVTGSGPGFTPWAILISALVGATTAIVVVAKQRITTHKQKTLDFLILLKTDRDYKEDEQVFAELVRGENLVKVDNATTNAEIKQRLSVINYLNVFELMCLSIRENVLDENICKYVVGDNLTKRWADAYPLINTIRNKTNPPDTEFFEHFEMIATRWQQNPTVIKKSGMARIWDEIRRL